MAAVDSVGSALQDSSAIRWGSVATATQTAPQTVPAKHVEVTDVVAPVVPVRRGSNARHRAGVQQPFVQLNVRGSSAAEITAAEPAAIARPDGAVMGQGAVLPENACHNVRPKSVATMAVATSVGSALRVNYASITAPSVKPTTRAAAKLTKPVSANKMEPLQPTAPAARSSLRHATLRRATCVSTIPTRSATTACRVGVQERATVNSVALMDAVVSAGNAPQTLPATVMGCVSLSVLARQTVQANSVVPMVAAGAVVNVLRA